MGRRSDGQTQRIAQHDDLEQRQLPVKEMADAGNDDHRQRLRPRPVERGRERHDVVGLAVDDERVRRHRRQRRSSRIAGPTSTRRRGCSPAGRLRAAASRHVARRTRTRPAPAAAPAPRCAAMTASASSTSPRPSSQTPPESPMPRKLKRTARQPSCTKARASVCTTLLSIVPPCCGCGWQMTATPRCAPSGPSIAHSMRAGRAGDAARAACAGSSAPDVRRQQQPLDDLAVLQVRIDDLVDVVLVDVGVPDRFRDRPPRPARRRSGRGSRPC